VVNQNYVVIGSLQFAYDQMMMMTTTITTMKINKCSTIAIHGLYSKTVLSQATLMQG
jgi:hypothetical protein